MSDHKTLPPRLAYLGHLAMVLGLVLSMGPWAEFKLLPRTHHVAAATGIAWVVGGLLIYARWLRERDSLPGFVASSLVVCYSIAFTLLAIEITSRILHEDGVLWKPGSVFRVKNDSRITPGIRTGEARFSVNELGLRGPSVRGLAGRQGIYRIVAVGGSTTECTFLDDACEWPHLLMERLNAGRRFVDVHVSNAGRSGRTAWDHRALLDAKPALHDTDMYIFLTGVNDMVAAIRLKGASTTRMLTARWAQANQGRGPYFARLHLYKYLRPAGLAASHPGSPVLGVETVRARRAKGPWLPLPDLSIGEREYRERIESLADFCAAMGKRCLFMTQPTIWRPDLTSAEESLLSYGDVGVDSQVEGYVRAADLASAMSAYNQALLDVCHARHLECVDLARIVPKNVSAFYDDCHFNEGGARIVADALTAHLRGTAPFNRNPAP